MRLYGGIDLHSTHQRRLRCSDSCSDAPVGNPAMKSGARRRRERGQEFWGLLRTSVNKEGLWAERSLGLAWPVPSVVRGVV